MHYPYAFHHFTGSAEHNTAMRGRARRMDLKMNEYGLFSAGRLIPCEDEKRLARGGRVRLPRAGGFALRRPGRRPAPA